MDFRERDGVLFEGLFCWLVGCLLDGISFEGGEHFVLISSTNCLCPSSHHFQVH